MTATAEPSIRMATSADRDRVLNTLLQAFSRDPAARWAFPHPQQYLAAWPPFVLAFGGKALERGTAHCVADFAGAALWLPPGETPDEAAMVELLERTVTADVREDVCAVMERMGEHRPHEPHWYLPLIGVRPFQQGNGYGSALLRHALRQFDSEGATAYLESSNTANLPLYERHGFVVIGEIQVGSSPTIYPMVWRPRCACRGEGRPRST